MNNGNEINSILKKLNLTEEEGQSLFKHFIKKYINEECYLEVSVSANNQKLQHNYAEIEVMVSLNVEGETLLHDTSSANFIISSY